LIHSPSCESGFKFNLVDRVVQLSSPCAPDERWPMGDRVYDQARFKEAADVRHILEEIPAYAHGAVRTNVVTVPAARLEFEPAEHGFNLTSPHLRQRFENSPEAPHRGRPVALIQAGCHDTLQVIRIPAVDCGAQPESVRSELNRLFRLALLDDEPAAPGPAPATDAWVHFET
jgi:hypothetical protein